MAYKVIKYYLNTNGTIPDFLYSGNDGLGGLYPRTDTSKASPQDMQLIGIAADGATLPAGQAEEIASQEDLVTYLNSYTSEWKQPDPAQPNNMDAQVAFDQSTAAANVWNTLTALNGA
jgi:hypothetical protein